MQSFISGNRLYFLRFAFFVFQLRRNFLDEVFHIFAAQFDTFFTKYLVDFVAGIFAFIGCEKNTCDSADGCTYQKSC